MARSRNIKPGFFTNEDLVELDFGARLLFAGLWTLADKAGRLEDRPKKIKMSVFPADDVNVEAMLSALADRKFIVRYTVNGAAYIQIANWSKHQNPHHTEKASVIPECPNGEITVKAPEDAGESPQRDGGNLADSLIPDSGFTDSSVPNGTGAVGAKPPKLTDPKEIIFGYGLSLLVNAGTPEKQARSFLGGRVKEYDEAAVIDKLRECAKARPLQPLEWLAAALPPAGSPKAKTKAAAAQSFAAQDREAGMARWEQMTGQVHPDRANGSVIDITPVAPAPLRIEA